MKHYRPRVKLSEIIIPTNDKPGVCVQVLQHPLPQKGLMSQQFWKSYVPLLKTKATVGKCDTTAVASSVLLGDFLTSSTENTIQTKASYIE